MNSRPDADLAVVHRKIWHLTFTANADRTWFGDREKIIYRFTPAAPTHQVRFDSEEEAVEAYAIACARDAQDILLRTWTEVLISTTAVEVTRDEAIAAHSRARRRRSEDDDD